MLRRLIPSRRVGALWQVGTIGFAASGALFAGE
jgi:hypothetical protein